MARLPRIHVVFLYVADLARGRRFYEETLGFGPPVVAAEEWIEFALDGGAHFALHRTTPEALVANNPAGAAIQFCVQVDDLRATHADLSARGVSFIRGPEQGHGFEFAELEDPEGNRVRLIEFPAVPDSTARTDPSCH